MYTDLQTAAVGLLNTDVLILEELAQGLLCQFLY